MIFNVFSDLQDYYAYHHNRGASKLVLFSFFFGARRLAPVVYKKKFLHRTRREAPRAAYEMIKNPRNVIFEEGFERREAPRASGLFKKVLACNAARGASRHCLSTRPYVFMMGLKVVASRLGYHVTHSNI